MKWLDGLLGTKCQRDMRALMPYVSKINEFDEQYTRLSDDELRAKTDEFKGRLSGEETPEDIMRKQTEPSLPVRVAAPGVLYFAVPERADSFDLLVQARGDDNAAVVTVRDSDGRTCAEARGELDEPEALTAIDAFLEQHARRSSPGGHEIL